jgi:hypothetical protein
VKSTKPPNLEFVYAALFAGKITEEEGKDLNPKFEPNKQYGNLQFGDKKNKKGSRYTQLQAYRTHYRGSASLVPSCTDIHSAVESNYITEEEGKDLNKNYNPEIYINLIQYRRMAKARSIKESGLGKTPSLVNVHRAYKEGYIQAEEAITLNSDYDLSNKYKIKYLNNSLKKQDSGYFMTLYYRNKNEGVIKNDR